MCVLVEAMASYAAESANAIAARLASSPDLLDATRTYPSFATSPYPGVRYAAAVFPLLFSLLAIIIPILEQQPRTWTALWVGLIFIGSAYVPLAIEVRKPVGML
jgi:hypothetical protein